MTAPRLPLDAAALSQPFASLNPIDLVDQSREALTLAAQLAQAERERDEALRDARETMPRLARVQQENERLRAGMESVQTIGTRHDDEHGELLAPAAAQAAIVLLGSNRPLERERTRADALAALNERLRGALREIRGFDDTWAHRGHEPSEFGHECRTCWIMRAVAAALAMTPAAALAEHDARVRAEERERCAKVCDERCALVDAYDNDYTPNGVAVILDELAAAIRALGEPNAAQREGE